MLLRTVLKEAPADVCRIFTPDKPVDRSRWRGRGYYYCRGGSAVGLPVPHRKIGSPEAETALGLFCWLTQELNSKDRPRLDPADAVAGRF